MKRRPGDRVPSAMQTSIELNEPPSTLLDRASLFLDLDGTLAEFVRPDESIEFGDEMRSLLRRLSARLGGRLALVSGRALSDLAETVGLDELELAGSHGLERRQADGRISGPPAPPSLPQLLDEVRRFARQHELTHEEKPAGVAIHFRGRPELDETVTRFAADAAGRHDLLLQSGSMVRELRAKGADKGDVVRALMQEKPFSEGRPLFVGDDLTDEDGFAAAMECGGAGVLVGKPRPTAAQYRIGSVAGVRAWLADQQ